jgi:hypothetical protein
MIWCYIKYACILRHKISGGRKREKNHIVYYFLEWIYIVISWVCPCNFHAYFIVNICRLLHVEILKVGYENNRMWTRGQCNLENKKCLSESVQKDTLYLDLQLSTWINPQIFSDDQTEYFSEKFDFHSKLRRLIWDFSWLHLVFVLDKEKQLHNLCYSPA